MQASGLLGNPHSDIWATELVLAQLAGSAAISTGPGGEVIEPIYVQYGGTKPRARWRRPSHLVLQIRTSKQQGRASSDGNKFKCRQTEHINCFKLACVIAGSKQHCITTLELEVKGQELWARCSRSCLDLQTGDVVWPCLPLLGFAVLAALAFLVPALIPCAFSVVLVLHSGEETRDSLTKGPVITDARHLESKRA